MGMGYKPGRIVEFEDPIGYSKGLGNLYGGLGGLANSYAQQVNQRSWNLTEEERQKIVAEKEEERAIRQQKRAKALGFIIKAIGCAGFTAFVTALNCNLNVHDYNTSLISSVLWGLGISGLGFTALLIVLGIETL